MKSWNLRDKIAAIVIGILVIAAVVALVHRDGEKKGAVAQDLKANAVQVKQLRADAVAVRAQTIAKRKEYHAARAKVVVQGDTVIADGQSVAMPSVANLVRAADAHSAQDSTDQAKQDLLIGTLGKRVDLLETDKQPWCGRKCGIAIGVAGAGATVYVAIRIIRAVAHK